MYDRTRTYRVGDTIDHPTFGLGSVEAVRESVVIAMFGHCLRRLAHAQETPMRVPQF
jgi:RNA polymerase-interacting CarD/CdnL/TRCF family regulator